MPVHAPKRVTRGGSFLCNDDYCLSYRPSARRGTDPYNPMSHLGFRLVEGRTSHEARASLLASLLLRMPSPARRIAADALPSWNDGATKSAIVDFVAEVTTKGGKDFVPPAERIATFDNDGTLWAEQPMYFQFLFALDRVKALAPQHPEWKDKEPFASLLKGDVKGALAGGEHALLADRWPRRIPA